jgi:hypothetical protein
LYRDSYKDDLRIEDRKRDAEGGEDRDVYRDGQGNG